MKACKLVLHAFFLSARGKCVFSSSMQSRFLLLILLSVCLRTTASDSLVTALLQRVAALQVKQYDAFPAGAFPSYRAYALNQRIEKADVNPFFTGLIVFTLDKFRHQFNPGQKAIADKIMREALPMFKKFESPNHPHIYNYWPTDTVRVFPNGGWLNWFDKKHALANDLDDTVILLMAMNSDSSIAAYVHNYMQAFVNTPQRPILNTKKHLAGLGAYSTWFGVKMPIDFDICVLSNVLYFVQSYQLKWTQADSATLQVLTHAIDQKDYLTDGAYVSPHYEKPAIFLYHLARLMSVKPIPVLEERKAQLIEQAKTLLDKTHSPMEGILLSTALLRWGQDPASLRTIEIQSLSKDIEDADFSFFIANMASFLPAPWKRIIGNSRIGYFRYYCPAYNYVLLLEYLMLNR